MFKLGDNKLAKSHKLILPFISTRGAAHHLKCCWDSSALGGAVGWEEKTNKMATFRCVPLLLLFSAFFFLLLLSDRASSSLVAYYSFDGLKLLFPISRFVFIFPFGIKIPKNDLRYLQIFEYVFPPLSLIFKKQNTNNWEFVLIVIPVVLLRWL